MKYRVSFTVPNLENLFVKELESLYFGNNLSIVLANEDTASGVNLMSRGKMRIESKLREVLGFDVDSITITGIVILT